MSTRLVGGCSNSLDVGDWSGCRLSLFVIISQSYIAHVHTSAVQTGCSQWGSVVGQLAATISYLQPASVETAHHSVSMHESVGQQMADAWMKTVSNSRQTHAAQQLYSQLVTVTAIVKVLSPSSSKFTAFGLGFSKL